MGAFIWSLYLTSLMPKALSSQPSDPQILSKLLKPVVNYLPSNVYV